MTSFMPTLATPNIDAVASTSLAAARAKNSPQARMRAQAQDFEAQFLNSMFQQMYAGVGGNGPFGNSTSVGPWRSFLTDEYAKAFAKNGGIGIADAVYKQMLARVQPAQPQAQAQPQAPSK
jgi:flagellar protein FlgJ